MAYIKRSTRSNVTAVLEDPTPSSNTIYFFGEAHNKSTFSPIFDGMIETRPNDGPASQIGYNNNTDSRLSAGATGASLVLTKETASVIYTTQTGNDERNNVALLSTMSMDEDNPAVPIRRWTDGSQSVIYWSHFWMAYGWFDLISWTNLNQEMYEVEPTARAYYNSDNFAPGNYVWYYQPMQVLYRDSSTNLFSGICNRQIYYNSYQYNRPFNGLLKVDGFPSYSSWGQTATRDQYNTQFIGPSTQDGQPIYIQIYTLNDHSHYIVRHNISPNTSTTLHSYTAAPAASGSNYGGTRSTTGLGNQAKQASKTFDDPSSAGNKGFYVPYFDTSNNYFPFFYQWDRSTDTFTRNDDVTITGDLISSHMHTLASTRNGDRAGQSAVIYNETFVSGGTRYLSVIPMASAYQVNDSQASARTIVTYSVDASNPKSLTHHSAVEVPATIKNVVFLNDARTSMGVFNQESFHIYNFDNVNGWVKTSTLPYQFWSVGRDSQDRIWGTAYNTSGYVDVHLITPSVATSIVITPASNTYNYSGSNINSTINVSAYNSSGSRIATSVDLTIDGSTMTFSGGATTTTVTTSTSADVSEAIVITGAGFSEIIAKVDI